LKPAPATIFTCDPAAIAAGFLRSGAGFHAQAIALLCVGVAELRSLASRHEDGTCGAGRRSRRRDCRKNSFDLHPSWDMS
jgi:hypothetical protein